MKETTTTAVEREKAGKYRTTCAPFGYTKGDDPNHLPVIDPDAATYRL